MNIKVLPYINTSAVSADTNTSNTTDSSSDSSAEFSQVLDAAKKTTIAMAIDKLVLASNEGAVDSAAVQQFFDQHGINIRVAPAVSSSNNTYSSADVSSNSSAATGSDATSSANATVSAADGLAVSNSTSSNNAVSLTCSAQLDDIFNEASQKYGVDVSLLKAIAKCESNFSATAVSNAGAIGVMQLMPSTASSLGVTDPYDPYQNIMGGAKLISQFLSDYDQDTSLALAAYNAGPGNVKKYGGIPPFKETQNYVQKVLSYCQ